MEDVMSTSKKPLKPDDFPVNAEGKKIKKQDGTPIANTEDPAVAADVAERLNDDEARRTRADTTAARNSRRCASREPHGPADRYSASLVISSAAGILAIDISDWFGADRKIDRNATVPTMARRE